MFFSLMLGSLSAPNEMFWCFKSDSFACGDMHLGAKYLVFFSSRSLKTREKYISFAQLVLLSLYIFWEKCVYFSIFEWWNQVDSGWIGWETLTFWKKIDFQIGFLQTNFLLNSLDLKVTNAKISLDSQSEGVPMHANCQKVNKVHLPTFIFCW